jgi:hypothetical protein
MSRRLFTIGHSTHPFDRFLALLTQHGIKVLADIRRFPSSRKFPQFNQDNLASTLPEAGIEYRWLAALGGRRGKKTNGLSNNLGLRNESFRNYADYMLTEGFREGVRELLGVAMGRPTGIYVFGERFLAVPSSAGGRLSARARNFCAAHHAVWRATTAYADRRCEN